MRHENIQSIVNNEIVRSVFIMSIIILFVLICKLILQMIYRIIIRISFLKKYKITKIPRSVKVRKKKKQRNYFFLKYPEWYYCKKDGTADLRMSYNRIVWRTSKLYVDGFMIMSKYPYELLEVVKKLRSHGVKIDLCKEEKRKYNELLKARQLYIQNTSIQKIVDYYREKPTEFEQFCAQLYSRMGYLSKVTPPTNDGGYDVIISNNNTTSIIECKCYSINNTIGRPMIQKLVGANIIGADHMIFITTSKFSKAAIDYAEKVGVELIDGNKLMGLINTYMSPETQGVEVSLSECQLEIRDMKPFVPSDIYREYF